MLFSCECSSECTIQKNIRSQSVDSDTARHTLFECFVNAIAAFDNAMLDVMEFIWNRGFSESQRERACLPIKSGGVGLPWAFVLAWPIYVASRKQSQDLQSKMATAAPTVFSRFWLPILCSNMFRKMICK
jgi:hypothetical protein